MSLIAILIIAAVLLVPWAIIKLRDRRSSRRSRGRSSGAKPGRIDLGG